MELLIMATATNGRLEEVLEVALNQNYSVTFLVQEKRKDYFERKYSEINIISIPTDYIEYSIALKESNIKQHRFDEAWIPSGFESDIGTFAEAIALAVELGVKKVVWIDPDNQEIIVKKPGLQKRMQASFFWIAYLLGKYYSRFQTKIRGYD